MTEVQQLPSLLDDVHTRLERLGRDEVLRRLRPGLPKQEVANALAQHDYPSSPEVLEWFGWRDGVEADDDVVLDDIHLVPGFYPLTLSESLSSVRAYGLAPTTHLPLLADGGGDFITLSLREGWVARFRSQEAELERQADSLAGYLMLARHCFDSGVFFVDPAGGWLDQDEHGYSAAMPSTIETAEKKRSGCRLGRNKG